MLDLLADWTERGWLRPLDLALVRFCQRECPDASPLLLLATALVSHQLGRGHVCLDLAQTLSDPYMVLSLPPDAPLRRPSAGATPTQDLPLQPNELLRDLSLDNWISALQHPDLVSEVNEASSQTTPLVRVGQRLYLYRYWRYERQVEAAIQQRLALGPALRAALPAATLTRTLHALFPGSDGNDPAQPTPNWQKIACALAAGSAFSIITGGPGTGKTTTVVRLLALLQSLALEAGPPLRIRLAAPTGKAAARLKTAIAQALAALPAAMQQQPALIAHIPSDVSTLHRLLGTRPNSRHFRHHVDNPLPLDVLVVDEASMIDLEMMATLLRALPPSARLVLLGDKDQLASVEAGSVLGELCRRAEKGHFRPDTAHWLQQHSGEILPPEQQDPAGTLRDQSIVMLRHSHRFSASSGIGQLAYTVNQGKSEEIEALWRQDYPDIAHLPLPDLFHPDLSRLVLGQSGANRPASLADYLHCLRAERPSGEADAMALAAWARRILDEHARFQWLCALRQGSYGVEGINPRLEALLAREQLIAPSQPWYEGRPVIVTRNDYALGLMNGDIGITLERPIEDARTGQRTRQTRVAFADSEQAGGIRWVLPSRLQSCETVYALTVHKAQGSEFEHAVLLLPPERNPVLTRELLYTAITRGKKRFSLLTSGPAQTLSDTIARRIQRAGGLFAGED